MRKTRLLFVCVGNTCRSQMAEGFAVFFGAGQFEVMSAGTSPLGHLNRATVEAMRENGIDITEQSSKQLTDDMIGGADVVVAMAVESADDICPADFKGRKRDWNIEDPLGMGWDVLRRVRDDIEGRVRELLDEEGRLQDTRS